MSEPQEKTQFEKDIEQLSTHEAFARVVQWIRDEREIHISELHGAKTDEIQQISGMILEGDKMLQMFGWESLRKRHSRFLS